MEKHDLWPQWDKASVETPCSYTTWFIAPMEKTWFYERPFIVVMTKDKLLDF